MPLGAGLVPPPRRGETWWLGLEGDGTSHGQPGAGGCTFPLGFVELAAPAHAGGAAWPQVGGCSMHHPFRIAIGDGTVRLAGDIDLCVASEMLDAISCFAA